ncbi:MAG: DUF1045 domain-containing protein [Hyphomicrobiales bacterium]|nr:DUF1045 domain-containing protein [Hyphomicrobiales bacterium]
MRVAIYFTPPPDHAIVGAAGSWLQRDAFMGPVAARDPVEGLSHSEIDDVTALPRRYGFHATLKPPFRLSEGRAVSEVKDALVAFARSRSRTLIPTLALSRIGAFFALTPAGESAEIDRLAAEAVRNFDRFRAPAEAAEIARRRPDRLTVSQRRNLEHWGYPYVFDDFRFHMTLTGPVPENRQAIMEAVLRQRFAAFIDQPLAIDGLALFRQPAPSDDFVVESYVKLADVNY